MSTSTTENREAIVAKALGSLGDIATLPEVTVRIIEVVEDPEGTANQLHEVIKRDPVLSSKILKVVNSAFYGLPGQIANVDRAVVMLGLSAVKNIAIAASLGRMFRGKNVSGLIDPKAIWRHCVGVGVAAKKITEVAGDTAGGNEMFLAGLIHDLGLLVELQAMPEKLSEVVEASKDGNGSFLQLEEQIIGATHQNFGDGLTTKWKFPRHLRAAVSFHHTPENLTSELARLGMILQCADTLCCLEGVGFDLTAANQEFTETLLGTIGVTVDQLAQVRDEMGPEIEEAEIVLGAKH